MVSYHKFNERERLAEVTTAIRGGAIVALVTDAGTPGLSDPGEIVVRHLIAEGISLSALPGAQALLPALTVSGMPTAPFSFLGFLPRAGRERATLLAAIASRPDTLVFFESARRLSGSLRDLRQALGDRQACLARELTKLHESVVRGSLSRLEAEALATPLRGECVLVVAGAGEKEEATDLTAWVKARLASGLSPAGVKEAAIRAGLPRNAAYEEALRQKEEIRQHSTTRPG
jgi:16S rRNA (cytidine1402-2'-O)-methyltransferase